MAWLNDMLTKLLEDENFRRKYSCTPRTYGQRRALIGDFCWSRHLTNTKVEDREQIRRVLDAYCDIPPNPNDGTFSKYAHLPDYFQLTSQPKRNSSMERNLPALLRSDAKTIAVTFQGTGKHYTYVTHLPVAVGDFVVVDADKEVKIAKVMVVDNETKIEPGSDIEYRWVIDTVDMAAYEANQKRNSDIQAEAATIIRGNLRRSFAQQVLGAASDGQREKLLVLTGNAAS